MASSLRKIDTSHDPLNSAVLLGEIEMVIGTRMVSDGWPTPEWLVNRNQGTLNRLADLIEPTCDREALLALADEMVEMFRIGAFTGEGIDRSWCRELYDKYAKRIRETCGVVE